MSSLMAGVLLGGQRKLLASLEVNQQDLNEVLNVISTAGSNLVIKMGDNAGANKISFTDTDDSEVFSIDSNGDVVQAGTSFIINATTFSVDDIIATLGGDTAPIADDSKDRGIAFRYYKTSAKIGFIGWDSTDSEFMILNDATETSGVMSGTLANLKIADLSLTSASIVSGAITAVSYGGITEANLLDKSAVETISGAWIINNATGLTFNNQSTGGDPVFSSNHASLQLLTLAGHLNLSAGNIYLVDNQSLQLGAGSDALLYYNATNLIINPKNVGSGYLDVLGSIVHNSDYPIIEYNGGDANTPQISFDSTDNIRYTQSINTFGFIIGNTNRLTISSTAITSVVNHDFSAGIDVTGISNFSTNIGLNHTNENTSVNMTVIEGGLQGMVSFGETAGWGEVELTGNAYYSQALGAWKAKETGLSSDIYLLDGTIVFRTAPSAVADATVSFVERFKIEDTKITSSLNHDFSAGIDVTGITFTDKLGIGTSTVPHGAIGAAILAIDGANASISGAHIQFTTAFDNYPLIQFLNWTHDNIAINFDSYFDSAWKSSDAGSNFQIYKIGDLFKINYDSGIAAGSAITWNDGFTLDTSGNINIVQHNLSTVGLKLAGTLITASATEINLLDGVTSIGVNYSVLSTGNAITDPTLYTNRTSSITSAAGITSVASPNKMKIVSGSYIINYDLDGQGTIDAADAGKNVKIRLEVRYASGAWQALSYGTTLTLTHNGVAYAATSTSVTYTAATIQAALETSVGGDGIPIDGDDVEFRVTITWSAALSVYTNGVDLSSYTDTLSATLITTNTLWVDV